MRCMRCGVCCQQTDMLLSEADIIRLEKQGHRRESFVRFDPEGYALLRNRQGNCVFYNPTAKCCGVYLFRPVGCRVYPVLFDEDKGITLDSICPAQATITAEEKTRKGKTVLKILETIDQEAHARKSA